MWEVGRHVPPHLSREAVQLRLDDLPARHEEVLDDCNMAGEMATWVPQRSTDECSLTCRSATSVSAALACTEPRAPPPCADTTQGIKPRLPLYLASCRTARGRGASRQD